MPVNLQLIPTVADVDDGMFIGSIWDDLKTLLISLRQDLKQPAHPGRTHKTLCWQRRLPNAKKRSKGIKNRYQK